MPSDLEKIHESSLINVAGRTFRACTETTYEQDMMIMQILRDAGLARLAEEFNPIEEDLNEAAQDLIVRAFASGKLFTLLAATLEEVGTEWTMDSAKANGVFFSKLKKTEDKEALRGSIVGILVGFLISGVLSSKISLRSSPSVASISAQPSDDAPPRTDSEAPDASTSDSGTSSSAPLPDMTLTASP